MSGQASGIGYHVLYERMSPQQRARLLAHVGDSGPAVMNISGADSYPASLYWAHEVLETCPNTIVFERRVDRPRKRHAKETDDGIWQFDTDVWWNWRVEPYLDLLRHPRIVVVYDNESNMGDFRPYADRMVAAMDRGDAAGVAVGVGRFSTGTPEPFQYAQLEAMFKRLVGSRHWWTPNEYCGPDPQTSSGHLARFVDGLATLKKADAKKIHVAIGEAGLMLRYAKAMDERQKANYYVDLLVQWYLEHGAPWMVWTPENQDRVWGAQGVGETFYRVIEARLKETLIAWPPKGLDVDTGPSVTWRQSQAVLRNMGRDKTLFVRARPTTESAIVGRITAGKLLVYGLPFVPGAAVIDGGVNVGDRWIQVRVDGVQGYSHAHYLALEAEIEASAAIEIAEPPVDVEDTKAFDTTVIEDHTAWLEENNNMLDELAPPLDDEDDLPAGLEDPGDLLDEDE